MNARGTKYRPEDEIPSLFEGKWSDNNDGFAKCELRLFLDCLGPMVFRGEVSYNRLSYTAKTSLPLFFQEYRFYQSFLIIYQKTYITFL
jgi:hypothetical protein